MGKQVGRSTSQGFVYAVLPRKFSGTTHPIPVTLQGWVGNTTEDGDELTEEGPPRLAFARIVLVLSREGLERDPPKGSTRSHAAETTK